MKNGVNPLINHASVLLTDLTAKINAYDVYTNELKFIFSCLKEKNVGPR